MGSLTAQGATLSSSSIGVATGDAGTVTVQGLGGSAASVASLLDHLKLGPRGRAVVVAGDGFAAEPVDLAVLREGVLLHTLEGEPLSEKQGGPFRLLIPEDASEEPVSCANVKGVAKIVVREA